MNKVMLQFAPEVVPEFPPDYAIIESGLHDLARAMGPWYKQVVRGWEYWFVIRTLGGFSARHKGTVLDIGSYNTVLPLALRRIFERVAASDDFSWAQRDYAKAAGVPTPTEW